MKQSTITTIGLHIASTVLFYQQNPGLNYPILHVGVFVWLLLANSSKKAGRNFWGLTVLLTMVAVGVFSTGSWWLAGTYLLLLPYWVLSGRYSVEHLLLIPLTAMARVPMAFKRVYFSAMIMTRRFKGNLNQLIVNVVGAVIAVVLLMVFGQFYAESNVLFSEYYEKATCLIPVDTVPLFIGFQIWIQLVIRNASTKQDWIGNLNREHLMVFAVSLEKIGEKINPNYVRLSFNILRMGLLVLLVILLITEVYTSLQNNGHLTIQQYSSSVHETFDGMLASFLLTVLILGVERYFVHFRRVFSVFERITYHTVVVFNLVMISITAYKDYLYIAASALTERRLELLVWLLFAATLMVIILISDQRSAQMKVLLDKFALACFSCFILEVSIPYEHVVLFSYLQYENNEEAVRLMGSYYNGEQGPYSDVFDRVVQSNGIGESLKQLELEGDVKGAMKYMSLEHQLQSYTFKMWLESEMLILLSQHSQKQE